MNIIKKTTSVILVLAMMLCSAMLFASCDKGDQTVPDGMKEASNDSVAYDFYVPEQWVCDSEASTPKAYYSDTDASNVSVMAYSVNKKPDGLTEWWESFEGDFKKVYTDFEVVSTENVVLDGVAALKTVFKGTMNNGENGSPIEYQFMQVAAIKGEFLSKPQLYVFTYTSISEGFDTHLEDVQSMIDNFNFHSTEN